MSIPPIRPARASDAAGIAALWSGDPAERAHRAEKILQSAAERPDRTRVWVATDPADAVIAWGRIQWFDPPADAPENCVPAGAYLQGVSVLPPYRRRGLAIRLTHLRLDWLRGKVDTVWTFMNVANVASVRLHEKLGFVVAARDIWYPHLKNPDEPMLLMRLDVGPSATDTDDS